MTDDRTPLELVQGRIEGLANEAVSTLVELMGDDDSQVRLRASMTLLDRAGLSAKTKLELSGGVRSTVALDAQIDILLSELLRERTAALESPGITTLELSSGDGEGRLGAPEEDLDAQLEAELSNLPRE